MVDPKIISIPVEHSAVLAISVIRAQKCSNSTDTKYFFEMSWPQVYSDDDYDGGVRGFLIEILNCYCIIHANQMDLFVIIISMCLSNRFRQLNSHLERYREKVIVCSSCETQSHISNSNQFLCI